MTNPAVDALIASGLAHTLIRHAPLRSLADAAEARGVVPRDIVKTMVVRRGEGDHLLVLVPGDRTISWPKLRGLLRVSRLSMPDPEEARAVTGFDRGTITALGTLAPLPVVADARIAGRTVSIGAGEHGLAATVDADALLAHLGATVADVTDEEPAS